MSIAFHTLIPCQKLLVACIFRLMFCLHEINGEMSFVRKAHVCTASLSQVLRNANVVDSKNRKSRVGIELCYHSLQLMVTVIYE